MSNDFHLEEEEGIENHQEEERAATLLPGENMARGGHKVLSFVIGIFTCVLAVPVFFIYFIKSPSPLQDVHTFGISYYNLVFFFLISAVGLIFYALFFLRCRLPVILVIFITSLFCCLPLVIGLKNGFTLQQAILNIASFSKWPFFLQPLYILIAFLLPVGIFLFLFLQTKDIFSRKPHRYTFLGAASYLAAAVFIGFSGLIQAGQPNIVTVLCEKGYIPTPTRDHSRAVENFSNDSTEGTATVPSGDVRSSGIPTHDPRALQAEDTNSNNVQPLEESTINDINYTLGLLSAKINRVSESLEKLKKTVSVNQQPAIADIERKVEKLTVKLDQLLNSLNQSESFISKRKDYSDTKSIVPSSKAMDQNGTSSELTAVLHKITILSNKVDLMADSLVKKGFCVSE